MRNTFVQFIVVGLAALIVGFGANAMRGKSALQFSKNYFDTDIIAKAKQQAMESAGGDAGGSSVEATTESSVSTSTPTMSSAPEVVKSDAEPKGGGGHLEHDLQTITFEGVKDVVEDPMTQAGLSAIVDARTEQAFADGHIPGAMLCNPYAVAEYIDRDVGGQTLLDVVTAAEKVVVYCGGGDCEDSIFMARELLELGVSYSAIHLYEGGWKDWTASGGRVEKGGE